MEGLNTAAKEKTNKKKQLREVSSEDNKRLETDIYMCWQCCAGRIEKRNRLTISGFREEILEFKTDTIPSPQNAYTHEKWNQPLGHPSKRHNFVLWLGQN